MYTPTYRATSLLYTALLIFGFPSRFLNKGAAVSERSRDDKGERKMQPASEADSEPLHKIR